MVLDRLHKFIALEALFSRHKGIIWLTLVEGNIWSMVDLIAEKHLCVKIIIGPRREKTCLRGFRQSEIQTSLLSYKD